MPHVLTEIAGATDRRRTLIFVRGFQGMNELRRAGANLMFSSSARKHQRTWYRGLRESGFHGRLLTFRWCSHWTDLLSPENRSATVDEAAEALCDLLSRSPDFDPQNTSILGFSMGGWIIQRALRIARWNDVQIRRAYLFGAAAPRASRWPELLECVSDSLWNFHSAEDRVLAKYYPSCVGLYGLPTYYPNARDVDCTSLIGYHDEWPYNVAECLRRAPLDSKHL